MNAVKHAAVGQHVGRWTFWDIVLRDAIMYEIIWGWGFSNISLVCHLYFLVSACMCKFLMHTLVIYMHEHNHGTPSGCPHKHILSQGAHWVLTWLLTWLLTYYSLDYSLTTHLTTHLVLTWCSLGAHWVLIDPTWQPSHDASTELHHSSQQWKTCISLQRGIKK